MLPDTVTPASKAPEHFRVEMCTPTTPAEISLEGVLPSDRCNRAVSGGLYICRCPGNLHIPESSFMIVWSCSPQPAATPSMSQSDTIFPRRAYGQRPVSSLVAQVLADGHHSPLLFLSLPMSSSVSPPSKHVKTPAVCTTCHLQTCYPGPSGCLTSPGLEMVGGFSFTWLPPSFR